MRYDAFGTADEAKTQTMYDLAGNVAEVRSPRYFDASDPQAAYMRTTFAYNGQNQQSSQTRAAGSSIQNTTSQTYDIKSRPLVSTDANNKLWTNDYNNDCCDRFQGRIDPLGHGSFSNQDKLGRVVHTAIVQDYASHSDKLNPIDAKTFGETTTRFDPMGRPSATTVWLVPRGTINLDNPPIAGLDGIGPSEGLTTQTYYDSHMKDGVGFDSAGGVTIQKLGGGTYNLSLNAVMAKAALGESSGGAGSTFNPERSAPSAVVSINPEEELSVTITDGLGRHVISAQLQPWDGPQPFAIITWNCSVYDQTATIAGVGTVLESRSVDPLGFVTKTRTDGGGRTVESYDQENFKTSFTHDPNGNTLSVRDPNGVGYDAAFDNLNRQTSQTDTFGVTTSQVFDKEGNVTKQFDGKGNFTQFAFDALNRRKTVTDRLNGVTTFGYTPTSQLSALTDAENQSTLYDYNDRGEKIKETYPDHVPGSTPGTAGYGIVEFAYDPAGRTKLKTDQMGDTCTFNHDLAGRMLQRDYRTFANSPSGAIADSDVFTFDRASRMLTGHSGRYNNDVGMGYDFGGRLSSESLTIAGQTYTVGREFDVRNRMNKLIYPDGTLVEPTYTPRGALYQTKYAGNVIDTRAYDGGNRLSSSAYANGANTDWAYRNSGAQKDNMLASIATTNPGADKVGTLAYTWDANKNKTAETITNSPISGYGFSTGGTGYDSEDRVTAWNRADSNQNQAWNLSLVGDWNTFTQTGTTGITQNRTHGPTHEFLSFTGTTSGAIDHDPKGNMLTRPSTIAGSGSTIPSLNMVWDFDNRMVGADTNGTPATLEVTFGFDALGRRVSRTESGATVIYIQAGQQTIADYPSGAASSSPTYRYVYGSYVDEPILRETVSGSIKHYYHRNQQYSITALTDASGNVVERYAYTAYGDFSIFNGSGTPLTSSAINNRYAYTGREWDPTLAMYFFRARWMDALEGRFLGRDPIGFADGTNIYEAYWGLANADPSGNEWIQISETQWTCDSAVACPLKDLVKLVTDDGKGGELSPENAACIKPIPQSKDVTAQMKKLWPKEMGAPCGLYDVSNLIDASGGKSLALAIGGDVFRYIENASRFYGAQSETDLTAEPIRKIGEEAGFGDTPLQSVVFVGHGYDKKNSLGGDGGFMPVDREQFPLSHRFLKMPTSAWDFPSWKDAIDGKRPPGCWFTTNAVVRFAGCNTEKFAENWANKILRKRAIAWGMIFPSKSRQWNELGKGKKFERRSRTISFGLSSLGNHQQRLVSVCPSLSHCRSPASGEQPTNGSDEGRP